MVFVAIQYIRSVHTCFIKLYVFYTHVHSSSTCTVHVNCKCLCGSRHVFVMCWDCFCDRVCHFALCAKFDVQSMCSTCAVYVCCLFTILLCPLFLLLLLLLLLLTRFTFCPSFLLSTCWCISLCVHCTESQLEMFSFAVHTLIKYIVLLTFDITFATADTLV